ncbi:glycan biosynthesis protein [Moniliophthora roreri MCA 2997]|uniref:N-acetylglucosaminylphosphatidylinositol deacetylase n=2 Tax=Moniliophthora roreri TaxID=221103 RepID=V2XFF2_MONRO|nr:glycan biosynthesis protein [Moniliophthora roreri MCA 2997]KAI3614126.1 glycan biosynthesis protein [Moniliophthora roreri]
MPFPSFAIHVLVLSILIAALHSPTTSEDTFNGSRKILLLTAHPDDECLFFSPTILALVAESNQCDGCTQLYSMCLSAGDAEGLGEIRTVELERSLDVLGIKPSHRAIINHPDLQDNITASWDQQVISDVVKPFLVQYGIDTVLTFDRQGISGHPNHGSLPVAVKHVLRGWTLESTIPHPKLYTLVSVPLSIKYISIIAPIQAKFDLFTVKALQSLEGRLVFLLRYLGFNVSVSKARQAQGVTMPVFVAGIDGYLTALRAMKQHWSQLVWFRWLNVGFSRYMWVNEWVEFR